MQHSECVVETSLGVRLNMTHRMKGYDNSRQYWSKGSRSWCCCCCLRRAGGYSFRRVKTAPGRNSDWSIFAVQRSWTLPIVIQVTLKAVYENVPRFDMDSFLEL